MSTANIDKFSMDYSAVSDLAKEVAVMNQDFQKMIADLATLVESLDGQWQGKAQVEFAAAYSKLKPKLDTISEVLQNYATEINNAVANEQELETVSKALFSSIVGIIPIKQQESYRSGVASAEARGKVINDYTADEFAGISDEEKQTLIQKYEAKHPEVAERFDSFLTKSNISKEDAENIKYMVYSADEPYRSIYLEHLDDYNLKLKKGGGSHNILTNKTTIDEDKHFEQDPRGPYNSLFHESGHAIDDYEKHGFELMSKSAYYSSSFEVDGKSIYDCLSDDIRGNISSYLRENYSELSDRQVNTILRSMNLTDDAEFRWRARDVGLDDEYLNGIRTEVIKHYYDNVLVGVENNVICDAYGGMTNEVFFEQPTQAEIDAGVTHYGHAYKSSYWYDDSTSLRDVFCGGRLTPEYQTGKQAAELWADFFAAQITHDEAALSLMKQHFPTAYAAMEKMALQMV